MHEHIAIEDEPGPRDAREERRRELPQCQVVRGQSAQFGLSAARGLGAMPAGRALNVSY